MSLVENEAALFFSNEENSQEPELEKNLEKQTREQEGQGEDAEPNAEEESVGTEDTSRSDTDREIAKQEAMKFRKNRLFCKTFNELPSSCENGLHYSATRKVTRETKQCLFPRPGLLNDSPDTSSREAAAIDLRWITYPPMNAALYGDTSANSYYSLFCEDENSLEAALEEGYVVNALPDVQATFSSCTDPRATAVQRFACASTQAAIPLTSSPEPQSGQQPSLQQQKQQPQDQQKQQQQSRGQRQRQWQQQEEKKSDFTSRERIRRGVGESGRLQRGIPANHYSSSSRTSSSRRRSSSRRNGGSNSSRNRRGPRRPPMVRSYSMLDIENDAFTSVHENDVESAAAQCLRNLKTVLRFCLLCFGLFLLLNCPDMRITTPITFYYILCTMLAELCVSLCLGCSICMLAVLVGEQGAVYANATCGLLHRVAEGIAHYTLTGLGGYLLYNFRALEGVWYASGAEEEKKFFYLLIYVGCEAALSLVYSLQTLGTLFGICKFIVIKAYAKFSGRGDIFFLQGNAPTVYGSLEQYGDALRRMRNPVDVAFLRGHQQQHHSQHLLSEQHGSAGDKDAYYIYRDTGADDDSV